MAEIGEYYFQTVVKESKLPIANTCGSWRMFPTKSMPNLRLSSPQDLWISTGSVLVSTDLEAIIIAIPALHRLDIDTWAALLHWSIWELNLREHYGKKSEEDEDEDETLVPPRILGSGESNEAGSMWPFDFTSLSMQSIRTLGISATTGLN
ncbi:hypothetical protein M422DRAFT_46835 [Sphaerobolus stellatus SS14]|uniref:Uncharacterized protein n=1 Tax=Sphaerobolus stellatus (strain SS14) TaxID=990650 RepID=A0A0C9URC7_SPHS4|nr:hypothetical protein M422DRAFT_46835 [Sphaerobolus stellatus SS14]